MKTNTALLPARLAAQAVAQSEGLAADHAPLALTCELRFDAAEAIGERPPLPRFRMVAYTGGPMRVAGWRYPVIVDLSGLHIPSQNRPIRLGHDASLGVGHTDSIKVQANQLIATGVVSRDTHAAREIVISSRNGFPWQASIGAAVEEAEYLKQDQKAVVNGQEVTGPLNIVRKATLGEISFVDPGADGRTSASVAATAKEPAPTMDPKTQTPSSQNTSAPAPQATVSSSTPPVPALAENAPAPAATIAASAPQPATNLNATAPVPPPVVSAAEQNSSPAPIPSAVSAMRAEVAAEATRIAAIRKLFGGQLTELEAQAIREGWDLTRCELEHLRASRPKAPAVIIAPSPDVTGSVLEAACAIFGKLNQLESFYNERDLEVAAKRFRGGIGLKELLIEAAWANGYTGHDFRDKQKVFRYAFASSIQAGFSSVDIGGILSNVANKFMLDGFYSVERTWRNICSIRNVQDFKTVTSYRLTVSEQYELVAPGGELKHGTLGEEKYSNKADTYGLMLTIDRTLIFNDDLGAITDVPKKLGRGSGLKINDVFWTAFMNNAAFFTAGNKNYLTGADTALGIDGLTKTEVAFMEQVDSNGKPIGIMPSVLLVPPALSAIATQLNKSLDLRDTNPNNKFPTANPHQGKFRTEVGRYLSNSKYPGNSSKAWYLLADPNDLPAIEVAFLNGQESPVIESADADFKSLGIQMRGYHDFGVALQDPRAGVKAKGEV